ncbi:MAG: terminase, partial [Neisseria sp.]
IQIEAKKDMKARGVPSPNRADALVLSFAFPVRKRGAGHGVSAAASARRDFVPL